MDVCSCFCGGGLVVLFLMFVFLCLMERGGYVVEAVGCKGRAAPCFGKFVVVLEGPDVNVTPFTFSRSF